VNSQGGIYGRRLKLIADDDQLQCNQNEADYQDLVTKVFAFVGSWSLDDNCGATVLSHYPNVANVSQALTPPAQAVVGEINVSPFGAGAPNGPFLYYKQHDPADITKAGTLVGNQAAAVAAWHYARHAAESVGYKFIYEDDFPPAQNNFTADVVSMRSQGVQLVYIVAVNAPDLADFSAEANQQNWHPHLFASGVGYFGAYVQESSGPAAVEGQYVNTPDAMFLGEDAAVIPEVALFDQWMKNSYPDFPLDQFAATSWANSAMFVQALKMAGPHLTRAALLAALQTIHSFNDNGMVAPADPAGKVPTKCYIELVIHNGRYMRVDDPPSTFRCDGSYIPY
jgi:ABC-type branched-subunit amino acid transport system substrate-binding protein